MVLPDAIRNTVVAGAMVYGLVAFSPWAQRRWGALLLLLVSAGLGIGFRYLIPQDLLYLASWSGLGEEAALLPLWAVYGVLARRAPRPWVPGPSWATAPVLGALLGEVPSAAMLSAAAPNAGAAVRLAMAAAAGGMLGRVGDPALLVLGERVPLLGLFLLPMAAVMLAVARVQPADLGEPGQGSRAVSGLALGTALLAMVPGLALPALCAGILGMGGLAFANRGTARGGGGAEIAWALGSVGLVLISVAAGLPEYIGFGLEQGSDYLGRLPLFALTLASGLVSAMVDSPATSLLTAATLDRCPSLVEPGLGLSLGLGAAVGGTGPLVAAGALFVGWRRWLVVLLLAAAWMAALSPWLAPP